MFILTYKVWFVALFLIVRMLLNPQGNTQSQPILPFKIITLCRSNFGLKTILAILNKNPGRCLIFRKC